MELTTKTKKYLSPYPAEVIYTSDKNFDVRLKAMIEREAKDLGIDVWEEKFKTLLERIGENAEDCLFATTERMIPVS